MDKKCRKVRRDKYERNAPEIKNWWLQLFDVLEFDASIPPDKKISILKEVFPARILQKITEILSVDREKFNKKPVTSETSSESTFEIEERSYPETNTSLDTERSICDEEEFVLLAKSLKSSSDTSLVKLDTTTTRAETKVIPYMNFFKRRPDRAAIWRALPPLQLEEMNLIQKAEAITEAIAADFVAWMKTLSGDVETTLTVNSVMEMFEIAMQINSATSLCVNLKEMPSVPTQVAEAMYLPEMSTRQMLYREIMRDHRASHRKCRIVAFGRRLPTEMQVKPLKENVRKKWLSCEKVPQRLETMAAVWQGITHLKSTEAYCDYLYSERRDIKPPKYLVDCGMLDPASIYAKKRSTIREADGDVSNVSRMFNLLATS